MNGQCLIFIVKQLVEDGGRLNAVLFSRGKASIHRQSSLELRNASHTTSQDHGRNMSITLVPSIDYLKLRLRAHQHVTLKTYGFRVQSSYYYGAWANCHLACIARAEKVGRRTKSSQFSHVARKFLSTCRRPGRDQSSPSYDCDIRFGA